jgi:hypothetical protein
MSTRNRAIAVGSLLASTIFTLLVAYGLHQYESAEDCRSPHASSGACLMRSSAIVVKQISKDISAPDEATDILHGVVLAHPNGTCELWLRDMPAELIPQAKVELLQWRGVCVAVTVQGEERFSYYWEPTVVKLSVGWMLVLPVVVLLLHRYRGANDATKHSKAQPRVGLVFGRLIAAALTALSMMALIDTAIVMRLL